MEVTARATRQMPAVNSLAERHGKTMGWQMLLYRLKLLRKICQSLRRAFLQKMGLPPHDSYVWMAEQDELAVERMLMLLRLLGGGGFPARALGGVVREL